MTCGAKPRGPEEVHLEFPKNIDGTRKKTPIKTSHPTITTNEAPFRPDQGKKAGIMSANSNPTLDCDSIPLDRGDFVDSDHECDIEDESEDTLQYLNGYFHPLRIGDILNERY